MKGRVVPLIVAGVLVGLALGLGYGHLRLQSQEKACEFKIKEANRRSTQAQRRLINERDREREGLEAERADIQSRIEKLEKEKQASVAEGKALKAKVEAAEARAASLEKKQASTEARAASLEEKGRHLAEQLAKTESDRKALEQKQRQTFQSLQDREKELRQLSRRYDDCAQKNVRLCTIAGEAITRYEGKGPIDRMLEKEPFIQKRRVELEKLVQEYRDKVEEQKIRPQK